MGEFADDAAEHIRARLAARLGGSWGREAAVAGTPVDVLGRVDGLVVAVELEWRRADPVNNTAKLFRGLAAGELDADTVHVVQLFTRYYDLQSGSVSSKRPTPSSPNSTPDTGLFSRFANVNITTHRNRE